MGTVYHNFPDFSTPFFFRFAKTILQKSQAAKAEAIAMKKDPKAGR